MKNFILLFVTFSILFIQGCTTESKEKEKTTAPIFSKSSGVYTNSAELTINSNTQGAKIYYTLNGSEPDSKNGILYQNSLRITSTAIIKAIAAKDGCENSEISTIQLTIVQKYIVTFESNGGTTTAAIGEITPDSTISTPVTPIKSGSTFSGWYKEPSFVNKWSFESDKVTSDTTLYAKWIISEMVLVPSGTTSASNGSVTVDKDFYIAKYETTQAEFQEIMGFNPSFSKVNSEKYPVEKVNWYDSVNYCNKKSIAEGLEPCYNITNIVYEGTWYNICYNN